VFYSYIVLSYVFMLPVWHNKK